MRNDLTYLYEKERQIKEGIYAQEQFIEKEISAQERVIKKGIRAEEKVIWNEIRSFLKFRFLFGFKYPKLLLFLICIILSYLLFSNASFDNYLIHLEGYSYLGVFIAGVLFSFGFTSPFSAGLLLVMNPENIYLASIVGGAGCLIGDMLIFKFVKVSFEREFSRLKKERPFLFLKSQARRVLKPKLWHYVLFVLAGFFFASPFIPDEAAVTLLAGMSSISAKKLALISFVCNTLGILFLLLI
jgi:uncharacterized membrane protein YdjX (TVP38/TMEM64 family)